MAFTIRIFGDEPDFETLPAAKITNYPLEPESYKPYAQARVCLSKKGLHLHLLSFESESLPRSCLAAALRLTESAAPLLCSLYADGSFEVTLGDASLTVEKPLPLVGEDLQGVYWGGLWTLPLALLQEAAPDFIPKANVEIQGNFYKLCADDRRPHYGSFTPADFGKPLTDPSNLDTLRFIDF